MLKRLLLMGVLALLLLQPGYAQNLGLHVTKAELDLWRARSQQGPYKTKGDAGTNSPGDWSKITTDKDRFMANPGNSMWDGVSGTGCIQPMAEVAGTTGPKNKEMNYFVNAAFYGLVKNDAHVLNTVKKYLLIQAAKPNLQPSNTSRWCNYVFADNNPIFHMANWVVQLVYIYEYLEISGTSFTSQEKSMLDKWFKDWANFHYTDVEYYLNKLYSNRTSYKNIEEIKHIQPVLYGDLAYHNGPQTAQLGRIYNNRKANQVRLYGIVGVKYGNQNFVNSYKRFTKEFLAFACYSNGAFAEFHRGTSKLPDLGLGYMGSTLSSMITVADALARRGDTEIYDFETSYGLYGTQGSVKKSLKWAIQSYFKLFDGTNKFYRFSDPASLIDGNHAPHNWYSAHYCLLVSANLYYKDSYIKTIIDGKSSKVGAYPANPAGYGAFPIWHGDGGTFPGIMFMFNHNLNVFGMPVAPPPTPPVSTTGPNAPSDLKATTVNATEIRIDWKDNSNNETNFVLEVSENATSGFVVLQELGANVTTYLHRNLKTGDSRYYRVLAKNSSGKSAYTPVVNGKTNFMPPTGPSELTATCSSSSEVSLTWKDNTVIETGYVVEYSNSPTTGFTVIAELGESVTSYKHTGLQGSTVLYYRVRAVNEAGSSSFTNVASVTTLPSAVSIVAPSDLKTTTVNATEIKIDWKDNSNNETNFVLEVSENATSGFVVLQELGANVTTYLHRNLKTGDSRYYRVLAKNSSGKSAYTPVVNGKTNFMPPTGPSELTATCSSSSEVSLTWKDNTVIETGYVVEYSNSPTTGFTVIAELGESVTSYKHTGLQGSTVLYYRVRAVNEAGSSSFTNVASVTTLPSAVDMSAPSNLVVTSVTGTDIRLSWKDNSNNETGFILEVSESGTSGFTTLRELSANAISYAHTGMGIGTTRFYRIKAKFNNGMSGYSNIASGTTNFMVPTAPSNLTATRMSSTEVSLKWKDNTIIETGYVVEVSNSSGSGYTVLKQLGVNATSFNHSGISSGKTYYYRVKAVNAAGSSHYTNTASILVTSASNARLNATGLTPSQISLTWEGIPEHFTEVSIEYADNSDNFQILEQLPAEAETYVHKGLSPNQEILYRLNASDGNGNYFQGPVVVGRSLERRVVMKAYPNPNNGTFRVSIDQPEADAYQLVIYNSINETVFQAILNTTNKQPISNEVDLRGLGRGIYFVKIYASGTEPIVQKILVN